MIDTETRIQLEQLLIAFGYAVDRRDYDTIRRLYHPGAVDDHGGYHGDVEGLLSWFQAIQEGVSSSAHTLSDLMFARDGDVAESQARGTTFLSLKGDAPLNVMVVGRHFDRYERRDGVWKFMQRALCVDWVQQFQVQAGGLDLAAGADLGRMGADDPFYSRLTLLPKAFGK
ncbi:nuclear transport factor 2 family protein [Luteimonas sp. A501]